MPGCCAEVWGSIPDHRKVNVVRKYFINKTRSPDRPGGHFSYLKYRSPLTSFRDQAHPHSSVPKVFEVLDEPESHRANSMASTLAAEMPDTSARRNGSSNHVREIALPSLPTTALATALAVLGGFEP
jgi:hypothetical protein